jgi:hypothetical protein
VRGEEEAAEDDDAGRSEEDGRLSLRMAMCCWGFIILLCGVVGEEDIEASMVSASSGLLSAAWEFVVQVDGV